MGIEFCRFITLEFMFGVLIILGRTKGLDKICARARQE